jgi:uncharacterized protein YukE
MTAGNVLGGAAKTYTDAKHTATDAGQGNVLSTAHDISGLASDVGNFASEGGAGFEDPLQALIEAGLDFLLDLITPLKDALNQVTGDPDGLNGKAESWSKVADDLRRLGPSMAQDAQATAGSWTGQAGDAFRTKISNFERGVSSVAGQADNVASVLRVSATLMDAAQSIIKGIISSFVEYAIITEAAGAASAAFTFGASEAAAQAAVEAEAAVSCAEGADRVAETAGLLERAAQAIREVEGAMSESARATEELARSMRGAESALRSAAKDAARGSLKESVKDSLKEAGKDGAYHLGDDALHNAEAQSQDGHESQGQIDRDLSFGGS